MSEAAAQEHEKKWRFKQGDEIVPGRHALEKLGGGKSYEVYLAYDEHLSFTVVAKLVRPHLVGDEKVLKALRREAAALERLHHPLLVRGFGAAIEGDRPHILLEHLEGPHLARLIRQHGPLPLEQLIPLALNICSAIAYMAAEEMVHLDVKPRNIVVGAPPRLIDLSVARTFTEARKIRGRVGTDAYMAPEQCTPGREEAIGPATDVWGVGATLHHAISGTVPFPRAEDHDPDDLDQAFPQIRNDPNPLPKTTPLQLAELIGTCLDKDPARRPAAKDLTGSLEPLIAALPRRHVLGRMRPRITRRR